MGSSSEQLCAKKMRRRIVHQWPESFSFKILNLTSKFHQINEILHNAVSCMLMLRRQERIYKSFAKLWETMSRLFRGRNALLPAKTVVGPWSTVHGPWSTHRPWSTVHGPWSTHRPRSMVHGPWLIVSSFVTCIGRRPCSYRSGGQANALLWQTSVCRHLSRWPKINENPHISLIFFGAVETRTQ